jgi:nitric oxide reductase activation protein
MRLPSRMIVLITDGFPYDRDYEGSYAMADTRHAIIEARQSGTACVCLTVGGDQLREQITEAFGVGGALAVERADQVGRNLRGVLSAALNSVSQRSQRRVDPSGGFRRARSDLSRH